jgi:endosialidase-like protein
VSALAQNISGSNNTALGILAGNNVTTANNVICIGSGVAGADVDNTCFIGNVRDVQTQNANAIAVLVDSAGQLGTASSSRRFKKEIKPMESASETILALKPVTFHYKSDKTSTPQFGLIAEDVAEVNPDLVVRDKDGEVYTVRYDAVNAMLLNEFLKEHQTVQELKTTVAQQKKQIEVLTAGLQKVSAQLKLNRPAPQRVDLKIP